MARVLARFFLLAVAAFAVSACAADSPASPTRQPSPEGPAPTLPPLAEGRYRLLVTAAGPSMGCEITAAGVPLGSGPAVAAGYFSQDVVLRAVPAGWVIGPESGHTLSLSVTGASWPSSPVVTGSLAGQSDQRAYDGPAIEAGGRDRPATFTGAVVPGTFAAEGISIVLTGTVSGQLTFSSAWTGQVTVCRSAQLVLQQP